MNKKHGASTGTDDGKKDDGDNDDDDDDEKNETKRYFSSLWPLILSRLSIDDDGDDNHTMMKFPTHKIFGEKKKQKKDNQNQNYTNNVPVRRASIIYYLMLHGIAMEY